MNTKMLRDKSMNTIKFGCPYCKKILTLGVDSGVEIFLIYDRIKK